MQVVFENKHSFKPCHFKNALLWPNLLRNVMYFPQNIVKMQLGKGFYKKVQQNKENKENTEKIKKIRRK